MSSGGKGGGQTSQVTIPKYIEDASKKNLERADYFSQVGYVPYYGPDVAALSPMEEQAMRGTGSAMQAFGLAGQGYDPLAGMPQPQTFMSGLRGYSSGDLYDDALATLQERRPAQYDAMTGAFIDPITGNLDVGFTSQGAITSTAAPQVIQDMSDGVVDADTGEMSGLTPGHTIQALADAPGLLYAIPGLSLAKFAAEKYVNKQASTPTAAGGYASPYMHTDRGFSDDGDTYTSSYGTTHSTAGMSDATRAGLEIASSQAYDPYGYGD